LYNIKPRIQGVTPEHLKLFDNVSASTIGHFTDFGYVRSIQPLFRPINLLGNAVTVRIPHIDGSVIREALQLCQPQDVLVIDVSGDEHRACWGEFRTLSAIDKKIAGVVISGCATDVRAITELGFPVFCLSVSALTTRSLNLEGEVNVPISVGGVSVQPGDLVLGDDDGVFILNPVQAIKLGKKANEKQLMEQQKRLKIKD
jgi:regulator of RNase E activity RraA